MTASEWFNYLASINQHIVTLSKVDQSFDSFVQLVDYSMRILSKLIEQESVWLTLSQREKGESLSNIMQMTKLISVYMNEKIRKYGISEHQIRYESLSLVSKEVRVQKGVSLILNIENAKMEVPFDALPYLANQLIGATFLVVRNLHQYFSQADKHLEVNSVMISLVIERQIEITLKDPYWLTYRTENLLPSQIDDTEDCAFWSSLGAWDTTLSQRVDSNSSFTACQTQHVTSFQVALLNSTLRYFLLDLRTLLDDIHQNAHMNTSQWTDYMERSVTLFDSLLQQTDIEWSTTVASLDLSLQIVEQLIGKTAIWQFLDKSQRAEWFSHFVSILQGFSTFVNAKISHESDAEQEFSFQTIYFKSIFCTVDLENVLKFSIKNTKVEVPFSALDYPNGTTIGVTFLSIQNLQTFLSFTEGVPVNSEIIALIIDDKLNYDLKNHQSWRYTVENVYIANTGSKLKCASWKAPVGNWTTNGCYSRVLQSSASKSLCECRHIGGMNAALLDPTLQGTVNPIFTYTRKLADISKALADSHVLEDGEWTGALNTIDSLVTSIFIETHFDLNEILAIIESTLPVLSQLIEQPRLWKLFEEAEAARYASRIFNMSRVFSVVLNSKLENDTYQQRLVYHGILLQSQVFSIGPGINIQFTGNNTWIQLPTVQLPQTITGNRISVPATSIIFTTLSSYLKLANETVNAPITSLVIGNGTELQLVESAIQYNARNYIQIQNNDDHPKCGFWDFGFTWSTTECHWNEKLSTSQASYCNCTQVGIVVALNDMSLRNHSLQQAVEGIGSIIEKVDENTTSADWENLLTTMGLFVVDIRINRYVNRTTAINAIHLSITALDKLLSRSAVIENLPDNGKGKSVKNILHVVEDLSIVLEKIPLDQSDNSPNMNETRDSLVFIHQIFSPGDNVTITLDESHQIHFDASLNRQVAGTAVLLKSIPQSAYVMGEHLLINSHVVALQMQQLEETADADQGSVTIR